MIYFIIPVYKRLAQTKACVKSLNKFVEYPFRIIIGDDSLDREHECFIASENVDVVFGDGNLFWGGTINLCLSYLERFCNLDYSDVICFVNNDVIIERNTLSTILKYLDSELALYHSRVFDLDKIEIKSGAKVITWFPFFQKYPLNFNDPLKEVDTITARFLVTKYSLIRINGFIDEKLPHYGGDSDYSLRAKKKKLNTYLVRDSKCYVDTNTSGNHNFTRMGLVDFIKSFLDIKASHNMFYRYVFVRNHNNIFKSFFIVFSMILKTIVSYLMVKVNYDNRV